MINYKLLPSSFINEIVTCKNEVYEIRSNIKDFDSCQKWIEEFSEKTKTSWVVRNTKREGQRFVCKLVKYGGKCNNICLI
jgi:hypothetical protein